MKDNYKLLIDDIVSTLVEGVLNFQNGRIMTYHDVGKRIATDDLYKKGTHGNKDFISQLTQELKRETQMPLGQSLIYECILFYEKNPDIEKYLLGKDKSWSWSKTRRELHGTQQEQEKVKKCLNCAFHCPKH